MKNPSGAAVAAFVLLGAMASAASAVAVRDVAGMRMLVLTPAAAPAGSVLLIPGGTTRIGISPSGEITSGEGNFLVRSRERFVAAGYVTALLDDPRDVSAAVTALHVLAPPTFVVGTSNGTIVAADAAARLGKSGVAGIIFTSTVTRPGREFSHGVDAGLLAKANVPLLFVHNRNDTCRASPPAPIEALVTQLSGDVTLQMTSSKAASSTDCEAFSPHGYLGIEAATVQTITDWMDAHR